MSDARNPTGVKPIPAVEQIAPHEAVARQRNGAVLLDVREDDERAGGTPEGASGLARSLIAQGIAQFAPHHDVAIVTICAAGTRSLLAAETLIGLGYHNVASVQGGFARWQSENLPVQFDVFDADAAQRYSRHLLLPEVGAAGQVKLGKARIALIGAGGLGSPAALYLAAAGVGTLTLVDDDKVDKSNLQRQVIHADSRVGMAKVESAQITLAGLNPNVKIDARNARVNAANVEVLIRAHDVVIDGSDNFPTRYLLDAACRQLRIPLVYGAVHRFTGQVSVFDARRDDSPCYRCLFPEPPAPEDAPNCAQAGVLGVLPGIIGLLQASEALKLVLDIGQSLTGRLLCFDALSAKFRELRLPRDMACSGCSSNSKFCGYADIAHICAAH